MSKKKAQKTKNELYRCALREIRKSLEHNRPREEIMRLVDFWLGDIPDETDEGPITPPTGLGFGGTGDI